ncbi:hypothetical protein ADU59_01285 (plasmid) [Pararhizobium polonicum]|uniref:Uncharacterized protein n=1 Tax=Pararhizobium polonicum TaxID=1612624 RepID=A0A1C7P886_9HYPH|nr:hypothetical protein ADU59_01285 [Pararhizobium polonicum]
MSRTGASRVNPAGYVPTRFFELAKIAASGRLGQQRCTTIIAVCRVKAEIIRKVSAMVKMGLGTAGVDGIGPWLDAELSSDMIDNS